MYDIWNRKYKDVETIYSGQNYRIVINNTCDNGTCYIFFSSNNIWFPNTEESFNRSFIDNDYYEWTHFLNLSAEKIILIRDIYKSWYVTGVNKQENSVEKVIEFLKKQTCNMRVITVGSSAGGYMAALTASLINADRCICFSAQFNLTTGNIIEKNPFLLKFKNDPNRSKYYNITDLIANSKTCIFYIMPAYSKEDVLQMKNVENISNIKILQIFSYHHGVPILTGNLDKLLSMNKKDLERFFDSKKGKIIGMIRASVELCGISSTLSSIVYEVKKVCKKIVRR